MKWFDSAVSPGWFDWLGLVVALLGFGFTIWQVAKTRNASVAANDALKGAQRVLTSNTLQSVVTQFQLVVGDLDRAIDVDHSEMAHRALVRYAHLARETRTLLDGHENDYADLKQRLWDSSELALDVKQRIVAAANPDIGRLAKAISRDVNAVSIEMTEVVSTLRNNLEGSPHV